MQICVAVLPDFVRGNDSKDEISSQRIIPSHVKMATERDDKNDNRRRH